MHRDSHGGGGVITDGATQWMTAGAGVVHSEMPTEDLLDGGGLFHGVQLWVNLPGRPEVGRPHATRTSQADSVGLVASDDAGAVVRLIAGRPGQARGSGRNAHADHVRAREPRPGRAAAHRVAAGVQRARVRAVRTRIGRARNAGRSDEGQLAVFGPGDAIELAADVAQDVGARPAMEVLLLGGLPIREQIAWYGPFVMNTKAEIIEAIEDYQAGRMGAIPPELSRS